VAVVMIVTEVAAVVIPEIVVVAVSLAVVVTGIVAITVTVVVVDFCLQNYDIPFASMSACR
jgi:hypothetical protein